VDRGQCNEIRVSSAVTLDDDDDLDQCPPPKRTVDAAKAKRIIFPLVLALKCSCVSAATQCAACDFGTDKGPT
jgi:hypothetical protein